MDSNDLIIGISIFLILTFVTVGSFYYGYDDFTDMSSDEAISLSCSGSGCTESSTFFGNLVDEARSNELSLYLLSIISFMLISFGILVTVMIIINVAGGGS